jgi:dihydroorotase
MKIYLKNVRAINPVQNLDSIVNILIIDGKVNHISQSDAFIDSDTLIKDCTGLVASPGLFDMHVHLRQPGFEYREDITSGTDSAANGGFTGLVCMPNTEPCIDSASVVEYIKSKSKGLPVEVYVSGAITKKREGNFITEMLELHEAGVVLFTDDGSAVSKADVMKLAFDYASPNDLLISQHCEEHSLTSKFSMNESKLSFKLGLKGYPNIAEEIILSRDIMLAEYCGNRRYHAQHISTEGAVELIRNSKLKHLRISSEATPHHFVLTEDLLETYNSNYKMNPPLRQISDINAIINGIKDDTIDCIASDHAPHALHEKHVELEIAPHGIIGLETSFGLSMTYLVHAGHISLNKLIEKMSVNPRKILQLPEIRFEAGEIANLTIFNPDEEWIVDKTKFKSKSTNTPFNGFILKGKQKFIVNANKLVECNV